MEVQGQMARMSEEEAKREVAENSDEGIEYDDDEDDDTEEDVNVN